VPRKLNWDPESTDFSSTSTDVGNVIRKLRGQPSAENKESYSITHAATHAASSTADQAVDQTTEAAAFQTVIHAIDETDNPAATQSTTAAGTQAIEINLQTIIASHTTAEQKVYDVMLTETKQRESKDWYFTFSILSQLSGFRNRRTIISALEGLVAKKSIQVLKDRPGDKFGKRYRVFSPEEIIERRKKLKLNIDPQTRKVI
jgi:hypothetical protein